jgi:hypothetical protein
MEEGLNFLDCICNFSVLLYMIGATFFLDADLPDWNRDLLQVGAHIADKCTDCVRKGTVNEDKGTDNEDKGTDNEGIRVRIMRG